MVSIIKYPAMICLCNLILQSVPPFLAAKLLFFPQLLHFSCCNKRLPVFPCRLVVIVSITSYQSLLSIQKVISYLLVTHISLSLVMTVKNTEVNG